MNILKKSFGADFKNRHIVYETARIILSDSSTTSGKFFALSIDYYAV